MTQPITIEQLRQLHDSLQRELERIEQMLDKLNSISEDATAEQMLRVLVEISQRNYAAQAEDLRRKIDSLRPAMANIILATPMPGVPRQ
jgi:ribosomal protein RSM22 (predicted rRNA methylase)